MLKYALEARKWSIATTKRVIVSAGRKRDGLGYTAIEVYGSVDCKVVFRRLVVHGTRVTVREGMRVG